MSPFRATYRLQLTPDFGFSSAARTVPYLQALGISHLYLSPSLQARPGSTHGYDVVDPTQVSRDLGGEDRFRRLAATARDAGLGIVLDIVPNHMAADEANPWWADEQTRAEIFDYDPETGWYRRFFDVDGLAGVKQEDPQVFERTHAKVFELLDAGLLDGLRIDHPDGLADPAGYLERLRSRGARHVWVEKILHHGEPLRNWPVEGTTGYEFLTDITTAFVDPGGEEPITRAYQELTGDKQSFAEVARAARVEQATTTFAREVEQLQALGRRRGIVEALADLPVYRTYIDVASGKIDDRDRAAIEAAHMPEPLVRLLTGLRPSSAEFVSRFQQTSPPVVAKGLEDTALYRSTRLLALNDVGGDPGRFTMSVDELHAANAERQERFPRAMLASTTHDTKRTADTRARLTALAAHADAFVEHVTRWFEITDSLAIAGAPSPAERWFLFQTLLGAWPLTADRLDAYLEKALRETKVTTNWISPNLGWEDRVKTFARELLVHPGFVADFQPFAEDIARAGEDISVAQTVLRATVPGFPDIYQGDESWFLGLVDPDNRRPLDWTGRMRALDVVRGGRPPSRANRKLHVLHRCLDLRRQLPEVFEGTYTPLDAGPDTIAFLRGDAEVLVVVPVRRSRRAQVEVPVGTWHDALLDGTVSLRRRMPVAELTRRLGVTVLVRPSTKLGR
ncbi:MAG: malto-oligosyltrehalose synthase [Acidimicrobiia bacterium]|nr:malto-oligosyltrehalose synthase [Acidimicrobiia bacterium]